MNFNKVILLGRLTRDPEVRTTPSGQNVASFGIATNRIWSNPNGERQEAVEYHNIVAFGKLADICSRYLSKGRLVLVEGRMQTRSWEAQDGTKRIRTEIITENMQMGPRAGERTSEEPPKKENKANEDIPVINQEAPIENEQSDDIDVKDIPF